MKHEIKLFANKKDEPTIINAVFGDSKSHTFEFTIYDTDDTVMSFPGCTAKFIVEKKNGKIYEGICEVNGTTITHTPTTQAFTSIGRNPVIVDILGPSSDPFELRIDGSALQVASLNYDTLAQNSDEFQVLTQLIYELENFDVTFQEDFERWFTSFKADSTKKIGELLQLLQNVGISDNKAAYLAFLSKAAVSADVRFYNSTDTTHTFPSVSSGSSSASFAWNRSTWFNQASSPVTITDSSYTGPPGFDKDYKNWLRVSGPADLIISAMISGERNFTTANTVTIELWTHKVKDGEYARNLEISQKIPIGEATYLTANIPRFYLNITEETDICLLVEFNAGINSPNYWSFTRESNGSYLDIQIMPDLNRFPTGPGPEIIDSAELQQIVDSVPIATAAADRAETAADSASVDAQTASSNAAIATAGATNAVSWAVGGTGSRPGEDTDNAKFWAEQAHNAAGGGVTSFNGRGGIVLPKSGDYDTSQISGMPEIITQMNTNTSDIANLKSAGSGTLVYACTLAKTSDTSPQTVASSYTNVTLPLKHREIAIVPGISITPVATTSDWARLTAPAGEYAAFISGVVFWKSSQALTATRALSIGLNGGRAVYTDGKVAETSWLFTSATTQGRSFVLPETFVEVVKSGEAFRLYFSGTTGDTLSDNWGSVNISNFLTIKLFKV